MPSQESPDGSKETIDTLAYYGRIVFVSYTTLSILIPLLQGDYRKAGILFSTYSVLLLFTLLQPVFLGGIRKGVEWCAMRILDVGTVRRVIEDRLGWDAERVAKVAGRLAELATLAGIIVVVIRKEFVR